MTDAVLSSRRDAGGGLWLVSLEVDAETARAYTAAGQYVEVRTERGNGYFVLASDEGASPFQLLVRPVGDAAAALVGSPLGTRFALSAPLGRGFPLHGARGRAVVVAVVGTALAAARPVLRRRIAEGDAGATHIFVGVRSAADVPLADEVEAWAEQGARVVLCLSRSELHHDEDRVPRAERAPGYVQDAVARALGEARIPTGALVVAAGPAEMLDAMRSLPGASTAGVDVVTNV